MTSARRTPRYVSLIGPEPLGPQLMGPHPVPAASSHASPAWQASPAAAPASPSRRAGSSAILELHPGLGDHHAHLAPPARGNPPAPATPAVVRAPLRRQVPVERRPVEVLILSASPGIAPRRMRVARWQVRVVLASLAIVVLLASALVTALVVAVRNPGMLVPRSSVDELQARLAAAQDSLDAMEVAVEDAERVADSTTALAAAAMSRTAASIPARNRPLRPRTSRREAAAALDAEDGALIDMPSVITDLPVLGALASRFSMARRHPVLRRTRPHLGVDVAAPRGARVSAPAPGRVRFVGRKIAFGLVVELDHGDGVVTRYAHLRSAAVQVGEQVTKGEAIAAVGTSGLSTGPHLHYEVLVHGRQVDPLRFRFEDGSASTMLVPARPVPAVDRAPAPAPAPATTGPDEEPAVVVPSGPAGPSAVGTGAQDALPLPPAQ